MQITKPENCREMFLGKKYLKKAMIKLASV